jgi:hypothetical protein
MQRSPRLYRMSGWAGNMKLCQPDAGDHFSVYWPNIPGCMDSQWSLAAFYGAANF